jgi:hypothetical protein
MSKLTRTKVILAIDGCYGVLNNIARKCEVHRSAITQFLQKEENKDILPMIEAEKERLIDVAENAMAVKLAKGDFKATKFLLQTKGRHRGYVTKQEIEQTGVIGVKGYVTVSPDDWDKKQEEGSE